MSIKALIPEIRALVQDGFFIFPVHLTTDADGDTIKKPAVTGYTKLKIDDPDEMVTLFEKTEANAIGMVLSVNGLVVVDVDSYKPECNFQSTVISTHGEGGLNTLTAETGQGGRHYYYEADPDVRYRGKIKGVKAVDIKHRGFVVMPPSGGYIWINEVEILPAPEWVPTREKAKALASNPLAQAGRGTSDTLIRMVENAANEIDDRDEWLNVGLGLHHEYKGTPLEERAKAAYVDWSRRWDAASHDDTTARLELIEEAEKVWENANDLGEVSNPVTGATTNFLITRQGHRPLEVPDDEVSLDWMDHNLPPPDWLIEGFLETDEIMGLAGSSNAGKTRWLCMAVAALAAGRPDKVGITDSPRDPIRVMMVSNEETEMRLKRRLKATALMNHLVMKEPIIFAGQGWLDGKPNTSLLTLDPKTRQQVPNEPVIEAVIQRALDTGAQLLTFDPYVTLGVGNENAQNDNNEMFSVFRRIAQETGAAIVFIHHSGRGESRTESPDAVRGMLSAFRGSSVITSSMDSGMSLLPYLTPELAASKERRMKAAEMIKAGELPNYIALDWVKRRDAEMGGARYYVIEGYELPEGYEIAGMRLVTEEEARLAQTSMVSSPANTMAKAAAKAEQQIDISNIARILGTTFRDGELLSMRALHMQLQGRVEGWPKGKRQPSLNHGAVLYVLEQLTSTAFDTTEGTTIILRETEDESGWIVRIGTPK